MTVTIPALQSQLRYLSQYGYRIIRLSEVINVVSRKAFFPSRPVTAMTIDHGHRSVYTLLFPTIKAKRIPITLFIYPSAISTTPYALTWDQLREMKDSGLVEVQSHTYSHPNFRTERLHRTPQNHASFIDAQLARSRAKLESELGGTVDLLAWPYGIVDPQLEGAAKAAGYRAALTYNGDTARPGDDLYTINRIQVPDCARRDRFGALLGTAAAGCNRLTSAL